MIFPSFCRSACTRAADGVFFRGPGYEFTEKKDKFLIRAGVGYKFHLGGQWSLHPELMGDFIEGGIITWIGGIAIGYEF